MTILQQLFNAAVLGCIYALAAAGMAMIYGVLGVLHVAHVVVCAVGAYAGCWCYAKTHHVALALAAAGLSAGAAGLLMERLLYRRALAMPREAVLMISAGILAASGDVFRVVVGPEPKAFVSERLLSPIRLGSLRLTTLDLAVVSIAALSTGLLWLFLRKTRWGFAVRAVAQDPRAAALSGIDVQAAVRAVFLLGSVLAGLAGALFGLFYSFVAPSMLDEFAYKSMAIVCIGGLGSAAGAMSAGVGLAIVETLFLSRMDLPVSREGIAMAFVILFLLGRPQGLRKA